MEAYVCVTVFEECDFPSLPSFPSTLTITHPEEAVSFLPGTPRCSFDDCVVEAGLLFMLLPTELDPGVETTPTDALSLFRIPSPLGDTFSGDIFGTKPSALSGLGWPLFFIADMTPLPMSSLDSRLECSLLSDGRGGWA